MNLEKKLKELNEIGIALSIERNIKALLKKILLYAKGLTLADGGTLYLITENDSLRFEIVVTESLDYMVVSGDREHTLPFKDVPLTVEGRPNNRHIVAYAVNNRQCINVADAYTEEGFDFSGTKDFDAKTGYRTRSVLTIPIINHEDKVIGALQLINAIHPETKEIKTFSKEDEELAESLASQAGISITNQSLLLQLKNLFNSFVRIISDAIDEKSPSTGNHGKRVPVLAAMLAQAVTDTKEGPFKGVHFTPENLTELELAAFLHDCGKIVTPTHIVEKHKKLETIFDRIELIKTRLDLYKSDLKLQWLKEHPQENPESFFAKLDEEIEEEKKFIQRCNDNLEPINDTALSHLKALLDKKVITEDEYKNLSLPYGNLTDEERKIMQNHVVMTYKMLSQLPFPEELKNVPEIAASHHERVDGKGYPRGLKKDQMPIQARILTIADIFEALSAPDRPYKPPLPLSQINEIMRKKAEDGEIDPDLLEIFFKKNVGLNYAKIFLDPAQMA